jgi:hypothetical protein
MGGPAQLLPGRFGFLACYNQGQIDSLTQHNATDKGGPTQMSMRLNSETRSYPFSKEDLTKVTAYNASDLPEYIGYATPGTAKATAGWQICKLTYSGTLVTDIQFANGSNGYEHVWDDGAGTNYSTYTYS